MASKLGLQSLAMAVLAAATLSTAAGASADGQNVGFIGNGKITGSVVAIGGQHDLLVKSTGGQLYDVQLQKGTVITPRGLTLAPNMDVAISATSTATGLTATRIDTPYTEAQVKETNERQLENAVVNPTDVPDRY